MSLLPHLAVTHFVAHVYFSRWTEVRLLSCNIASSLNLLYLMPATLSLYEIVGNKCPLCRTVLFITPRTCAIRFSLIFGLVFYFQSPLEFILLYPACNVYALIRNTAICFSMTVFCSKYANQKVDSKTLCSPIRILKSIKL